MDHTFTLRDRQGNEHTYRTAPVVGEAKYKVLDFLLESGVSAIVTLLASRGGSIDAAAAGAGVTAAWQRAGASAKMIPLLMANTWRDGKRLSSEAALDSAYTLNLGEQLAALREVESYNGFFAAAMSQLEYLNSAEPETATNE